jgi:hypothetical protein
MPSKAPFCSGSREYFGREWIKEGGELCGRIIPGVLIGRGDFARSYYCEVSSGKKV